MSGSSPADRAARWGQRERPAPAARPLLVFLHVPKTAGVTMRHQLIYQYGQAGTVLVDQMTAHHERVEKQLCALDGRQVGRLRAMGGHFPYGSHEALGRPAQYVTLLRDPIDRVLSDRHHRLRQLGQGFDPAAESPESWGFHNLQTRMLGGDDHWDRVGAGDAVLIEAKRRLESFSAVGITERLDESLLLIRARLGRRSPWTEGHGWRYPFYVGLNRNPAPVPADELPSGLTARVAEQNAYDIELYRWALARFDQEIAALGRPFRAEVATFRRLNRRVVRRAARLPARAARLIGGDPRR